MSRGSRLLSWDGCVNVRDLGGYRTEHGHRTAVLLLHLVGVSAADIAADYALSITQVPARHPQYGDELMAALARHGTSVEEAITAVVTRPIVDILGRNGLTTADVHVLRRRLLKDDVVG